MTFAGRAVAGFLVTLGIAVSAAPAQQVPDTAFRAAVPRPMWARDAGAALCLDEGHHNFHTLDDRFFAFGELARRDGFRVGPIRSGFTAATLARCAVLVIANAQPSDAPWGRYPVPTPSAFTPAEVAAVAAWVRRGGALLLIADHMPLAGAASRLAGAFGFQFTDGFALEGFETAAGRDSAIARPTLFHRADDLLRPHPITRGRDSTEAVTQVRTFTGQAFRDTAGGSSAVLVLAPGFVILEPRVAWQFSDSTPRRSAAGWLQGATRRVGQGRVAAFGEAAMFSAQVTGPARRPMGMNAPGAEQNAQFVLNVLHWLAGTLRD